MMYDYDNNNIMKLVSRGLSQTIRVKSVFLFQRIAISIQRFTLFISLTLLSMGMICRPAVNHREILHIFYNFFQALENKVPRAIRKILIIICFKFLAFRSN